MHHRGTSSPRSYTETCPSFPAASHPATPHFVCQSLLYTLGPLFYRRREHPSPPPQKLTSCAGERLRSAGRSLLSSPYHRDSAGMCGFNVRLIGYTTPRRVASSHTGLQRRSLSAARLCAPTGTLYAARASLRTATRSAQCWRRIYAHDNAGRGAAWMALRSGHDTDVLAHVPAHALKIARVRCWCRDRNVGRGGRMWVGQRERMGWG